MLLHGAVLLLLTRYSDHVFLLFCRPYLESLPYFYYTPLYGMGHKAILQLVCLSVRPSTVPLGDCTVGARTVAIGGGEGVSLPSIVPYFRLTTHLLHKSFQQ